MNVKKNKNQLIISIIIGIVIVLLSSLVLSEQQKRIDELEKAKSQEPPATQVTQNSYVFAKGALKKGTTITQENVEMKQVPVVVPDGFPSIKDVLGLVLVRDMNNSEVFRRNCFSEEDFPTNIEPKMGYRSIGVSVTDTAYISSLKPNMYTDVYSTGGTIIAQNVKVLDIKKSGKGKVVFLEIKDNNISNFIKVLATSKEKFIFVLKNQDDDRIYRFTYMPPMSELDMIYKSSLPDIAPPAPPSVTNYNIEEFVVNEAPKCEPETIEIIRGSEKKEYEF